MSVQTLYLHHKSTVSDTKSTPFYFPWYKKAYFILLPFKKTMLFT